MKKLLCILLCTIFLSSPVSALETLRDDDIAVEAPSAILMERSTGEVIYEKNAYEHLSPASVTKVMTMLLVVEAIDRGDVSLEDMVTASAHAASMGGSQIWLEEGEQMSISEMLKCVTVVSANDCCVALAEHLCGTEDAFVKLMNERAAQLGMNDTHFTCCSGLMESDDHYSCARDIAIMSSELLGHEIIRDYTTIWMDKIRNGEFTLSNTNKLIYYYDGATGLKTGFTSKAMFCLSASAMRDDVEYIAVILAAPSSAQRFESAKMLLSYAFANYALCYPEESVALPEIEVKLGTSESLTPQLASGGGFLVKRSQTGELSYDFDLPESLDAPVENGQTLGTLTVRCQDDEIARIDLVAPEDIPALGVKDIFFRLMRHLLCGEKQ